jgi:hypothetical protein
MVDNKPNLFLSFLSQQFSSIVFLIICCLGFYYLKTEASLDRQALSDTIVQVKLLKDGQAILQGNVGTAFELERKAREQLGRDVMAQVNATNGSVTAIFTAVAELKTTVTNFGKIIGEKRPNGSFSTIVDQDRGNDRAPLTSVSLKYDASKSTLSDALSLSQWNNNKEVFNMTFGEWRTDKDGLRSSAGLKRTIYRDDKQTQKLGEEIIPVIGGEAFYSTDNLRKLTSPPKYTFITGTIHDSNTGKNGVIGILDTAVTREVGISTGYAIIGGNRNYMLGVSYKFGKQN